MKLIMVILIVLNFLALDFAFSCQSDFDCSLGSHCLKDGANFYGVCAGGTAPGNNNDKVPVYAPQALNQNVGKTCDNDFDCGLGLSCLKTNYSFQGVCK